MKTAEITLVADRWCPTSRTYCVYLRESGYKFKKIIVVDFFHNSKKYKLLRSIFGEKISRLWMCKNRPLWPDYKAYSTYFDAVQVGNVEHVIDYIEPFNFSDYTDKVEYYGCENYDDKKFHCFLKKQDHKVFLYTNGGIVPHDLLGDETVKFLHIHPGIVPQVRGSDGLLWSVLERGKPGVSCFYMDPGIDTGKLIKQEEFDLPAIDMPPPQNAEQEDIFYRSLLIAYDPHLRASLFRNIVSSCEGKGLDLLQTSNTNNKHCESFLWMHPKLRQRIISDLCVVK